MSSAATKATKHIRGFRIGSKSCLALILSMACNETPESEIKLTGGHASNDPGFFPATVTIWSSCTAAKIGKRLFLTAAHCVVNENTRDIDTSFRPGSKLYISNHKTPLQSSTYPWQVVTVATTSFAPSYLNACTTLPCPNTLAIDGADVAIFKIHEETPGIPQAWIDWSHDSHPGESLIITGYGCEEGLQGPSTKGTGRFKYQVSSAAPANILEHDWYHPFRDRIVAWNIITPGLNWSSQTASLCPGDSGGPLYRNDGSGAIVGVNSYYSFAHPDHSRSRTNWHTRLARNDTAWWLYGELTKHRE